MTLDYQTYRKIDLLLAHINRLAAQLYYDHNTLTSYQRGEIRDQVYTSTRALRDLTGLDDHKAIIQEELKQEQLCSIEKHKEYIEEFASTISQELNTIEEKSLPREDAFMEPATTKEEWLDRNEYHKNYFIQKYNDDEEWNNKNPTSSFGIVPVKTEVFVDEDILNAAKGFLTGPVGIFRGKKVCAETQVYPNIHEMKTFLLNVQCKTKDMVLYMTFATERKDFGDVDFFNLSVEEQQKIPTVPVYVWRGAFVDKI